MDWQPDFAAGGSAQSLALRSHWRTSPRVSATTTTAGAGLRNGRPAPAASPSARWRQSVELRAGRTGHTLAGTRRDIRSSGLRAVGRQGCALPIGFCYRSPTTFLMRRATARGVIEQLAGFGPEEPGAHHHRLRARKLENSNLSLPACREDPAVLRRSGFDSDLLLAQRPGKGVVRDHTSSAPEVQTHFSSFWFHAL